MLQVVSSRKSPLHHDRNQPHLLLDRWGPSNDGMRSSLLAPHGTDQGKMERWRETLLNSRQKFSLHGLLLHRQRRTVIVSCIGRYRSFLLFVSNSIIYEQNSSICESAWAPSTKQNDGPSPTREAWTEVLYFTATSQNRIEFHSTAGAVQNWSR